MLNRLKYQTIFLSLICVSSLILFVKAYFDEERLTNINTSLDEMYKDRLIAERYIYSMSELVYEIKLMSAEQDAYKSSDEIRLKTINAKLQQISTDFSKTKLSVEEAVLSARLQRCIQSLPTEKDLKLLNAVDNKTSGLIHTEILSILKSLSEVQMSEGQKLKSNGQASVASTLAGLKLQSGIYIILLISVIGLTKTFFVKISGVKVHGLN